MGQRYCLPPSINLANGFMYALQRLHLIGPLAPWSTRCRVFYNIRKQVNRVKVVNTPISMLGNGRQYQCRPLTSFCGISASGCTTSPNGILQPLSRSFEHGTVQSVVRTYLGLLLPVQEKTKRCQTTIYHHQSVNKLNIKLFSLTIILSSEVGGDERRGKSPGGGEVGGGASLFLICLDHCHLQQNSEHRREQKCWLNV